MRARVRLTRSPPAVRQVLFGSGFDATAVSGLLEQPSFTQPALVALALALYRVLTDSYGILPDVVIGHSLGEIAACCVGGLLSLDQALRLALVRGLAMQALPSGSGAMLAVQAQSSDAPSNPVRRVLDSHPGISIAAVNSCQSCVLSGEKQQIHAAEKALKAAGVRAKLLGVVRGFHSASVEPGLPHLRQGAMKVLQENGPPATSALPAHTPVVISTLSAAVLTKTPDAAHWVDHARRAVRFEAAVIKAAMQFRCSVFLEVGMQAHLCPHVLTASGAVAATHEGRGACEVTQSLVAVPTLRQGLDDCVQLHEAVASLFSAGVDLNVEAILPAGKIAHLPVAPLRGARFWLPEAADSEGMRTVARAPSAPPTVLYRPVWTCSGRVASGGHAAFSCVCVIDVCGDLPASVMECAQGAAKQSVFVSSPSEIAPSLSQAALTESTIELVLFRGDVASLQMTLQALLKSGISCPKLVALTQGLVDISGDSSDGNASSDLPEGSLFRDAATWGFVKSARLEMTRTKLQAINLDDFSSSTTLQCLRDLLLSSAEHAADSVSVVGDEVYREVLLEMAPLSTPPPAPGPDASAAERTGTALLTGGTGALALQLARWLVETRGVRRVVLSSRSGRVAAANGELLEGLQRAVL